MFSVAFAEGVTNTSQSSLLSFAPLIFLVLVFYFFILRPQQKKAKQESEMRQALKVGDKVLTTSGIFGVLSKIEDEKGIVVLEISKGVNVEIHKTSIVEKLDTKSK